MSDPSLNGGPPGTWIDRYFAYTAQQVSPRLFHFWSAVAVLGAALERKVFLQVGEDRYIYPGQMMVVLVSKSAVTKKTTAGSMAVNLLKWVAEKEPWQVHVLPRKLSPQQLLFSLQRLDLSQEGETKEPLVDPQGRRVHSTGFIWAGELGSMFSTEPFAEALATHVNDINDAPRGFHDYEFRSWKATLWNPCVGMLGCITPKGLAHELPKTARTAGFFGRLITPYASYTDRAVSLMEPVSKTKKPQREALRLELLDIARMRGKFIVTDEARQWAVDWYHKRYLPWLHSHDLPENEQSGYWHRKESHMLRVAMILSAAESRSRVLEIRHLEQALRELELVERELPHAFSEMHTNPYTDFDVNLLTVVERMAGMGWIREAKLRRAMMNQGGDRRFIESRETLRAAGSIAVRRMDGIIYWKRLYTTGRLLRGVGESKV